MTSRRPFLLLRIRFPGRPIFIQLPPDDTQCIYSISRPANTNISVTFTFIDVESNGDGCHDVIAFLDGDLVESNLMTIVCGTTLTILPSYNVLPIVSTQNTLWLL